MLRGLRCVGAARQAGARLRAPHASCRGLAMAANTLEEFPTPAPAAIASGSIISGDIINFNPQGDATDPTGCYRLNNAFADAVERHGMTAVHQANVVFDDYNQRDTRPGEAPDHRTLLLICFELFLTRTIHLKRAKFGVCGDRKPPRVSQKLRDLVSNKKMDSSIFPNPTWAERTVLTNCRWIHNLNNPFQSPALS